MENNESVLEELEKTSDDKTSENERFSQPSEKEQLNENEFYKNKRLLKKALAEIEELKASIKTNNTEDKTSEKVDATPLATETKSANNSEELNAVKEDIFRVKHPEISDENMSVLKSLGTDNLEEALNNPAFQAYMEKQEIIKQNSNATINKESGAAILGNNLNNSWEKALEKQNSNIYDFTTIKELGREKMREFLKNNNLN